MLRHNVLNVPLKLSIAFNAQQMMNVLNALKKNIYQMIKNPV